MTLFAYTSRFRTNLPDDYMSGNILFPVATNNLQAMDASSVHLLRTLWKPAGTYLYKKAGVIVWDVCREDEIQGNLFDPIDREKQRKLMLAIDAINQKNGYGTLRTATQGYSKTWHLKSGHLSGRYTTVLDEVIGIKATSLDAIKKLF